MASRRMLHRKHRFIATAVRKHRPPSHACTCMAFPHCADLSGRRGHQRSCLGHDIGPALIRVRRLLAAAHELQVLPKQRGVLIRLRRQRSLFSSPRSSHGGTAEIRWRQQCTLPGTRQPLLGKTWRSIARSAGCWRPSTVVPLLPGARSKK